MNLAKYCKQKGFSLDQYETLKSNITETAKAIAAQTQYTHGMYYPINDILTFSPLNNELRYFIINELKKFGFEFIEDYTLYRV